MSDLNEHLLAFIRLLAWQAHAGPDFARAFNNMEGCTAYTGKFFVYRGNFFIGRRNYAACIRISNGALKSC